MTSDPASGFGASPVAGQPWNEANPFDKTCGTEVAFDYCHPLLSPRQTVPFTTGSVFGELALGPGISHGGARQKELNPSPALPWFDPAPGNLLIENTMTYRLRLRN
jgi:hypothetical protein